MAEVSKLDRVFKLKDKVLKDPDSTMSTDDVLDFYSNQYPELNNSKVSGPVVKDDVLEYEFSTSVGTKG
jgi:PRTRC genetic system protein C